jgi:hypothetical protein
MFNRTTKRRTEKTTIDVVNFVLGACLASAPWVLGFTGQTAAAWNVLVVGAAVAFVAVDALANLTEWEEWANMALGIWAILAPWLLGFAEVAQAMYAHLFIGLIVTVLAAVDLWMAHNRPVSMA